MGNIRPSFIKIRAIALCEEYPDQFSPNEGLPVCNCGPVHECADCKHEMEYNEHRKLCEQADKNSKCKPLHKCNSCGHVMDFKRDRKKCTNRSVKSKKDGSKSGCKEKKFSAPFSANGFTDPHPPHNNPFDHNKKLVEKFTDLSVWSDEQNKDVLVNKRMRNWIAGYITTYKQRRVD